LFAGHQQAEVLLGDGVGVDDVHELALVDDREPVGEGLDLRQFRGDEQDGHALGPEVEQPVVDELDGPHVDAPGRVGGHEEGRVPLELPTDDELLLVAAR